MIFIYLKREVEENKAYAEGGSSVKDKHAGCHYGVPLRSERRTTVINPHVKTGSICNLF